MMNNFVCNLFYFYFEVGLFSTKYFKLFKEISQRQNLIFLFFLAGFLAAVGWVGAACLDESHQTITFSTFNPVRAVSDDIMLDAFRDCKVFRIGAGFLYFCATFTVFGWFCWMVLFPIFDILGSSLDAFINNCVYRLLN